MIKKILRFFKKRYQKPKAGTYQFLVVCAQARGTPAPDANYALRGMFIRHKPLEWRFFSPDRYIGIFSHDRAGQRDRGHALVQSLQEYGHVSVGSAEGDLMVQFSRSGSLLHWPMGPAMSDAMNQASAEAAKV